MDLYGFLLINKPAGITSYDCIRHIKRLVPPKTKIGHAGTLDPFATGLLIIALGKATKQLSIIEAETKTYTVRAKVGELTDTLDLTGKIVKTVPLVPLIIADFVVWAQRLMPTYIQIPPLYSSLKHNGLSLHRLVRNNKLSEKELEKIALDKRRTCTIHSLSVTDYHEPFVSFTTTVSKGTYIRSLANDIAAEGKTCATVYNLDRTKIGNIDISQSHTLESITSKEIVQSILIEPEKLHHTRLP